MDGWVGGRMYGWFGEWMCGCMGGKMDEQMNELINSQKNDKFAIKTIIIIMVSIRKIQTITS